jgi:hypothetical protein
MTPQKITRAAWIALHQLDNALKYDLGNLASEFAPPRLRAEFAEAWYRDRGVAVKYVCGLGVAEAFLIGELPP